MENHLDTKILSLQYLEMIYLIIWNDINIPYKQTDTDWGDFAHWLYKHIYHAIWLSQWPWIRGNDDGVVSEISFG